MSFPARLHDHRGHATTFVGDGILAYFEAERLPPLAIGIHRGPGLAGRVGCRERMEYAFVGRTMNLAARAIADPDQPGRYPGDRDVGDAGRDAISASSASG
jgi:class 3 adenylate cyclase